MLGSISTYSKTASLFGSSGIRRVVSNDLALLAVKVGLAVGKIYGNVVVGTDTRTSGSALKYAVISGLLTAGASCRDAGPVPTPTLAFATRKFNAGIMITASHNPPEYNGFKLWNPDGSSFSVTQQEQIEEIILKESSAATAPWDKIKHCGLYDEAVAQHAVRILQDFPQAGGLRVVVDAGGGAASRLTTRLLEKMGCEVLPINDSPTGIFPRAVEPTEANLGELIQATKESGAALGIAHDGDADRLMVVDEKGRFVPGDHLLAIFAQATGAQRIVTTVDASMAINEMGFCVRRTRVGDVYVSNELKNGGDFGGEPSGSWVFPGISLCPDGIYAAAQIVRIVSREKLSALVDELPHYPLIRRNVSSSGVIMNRLVSYLIDLRPLSVDNTDGMKLDFGDGWLLVRPSGTEPVIRLTVEAKTEARAQEICESGLRSMKQSVSYEGVSN